jgi:gas vesicle protein
MSEEITHKNNSTLALILTSGVLGAGFALALAPKSGSETRADFHRAVSRLSRAVDIGWALFGASKEFVRKAADAGRNAYVEDKPVERISKSTGRFVAPILASGIIGAGIALLLAPKSGSATRDNLKQLASTARDNVVFTMDKGKDIYEAGKGAISRAKESRDIPFVEGKKEVIHAI